MHTFTKNRQDNGIYLYTVGYWSPAAYGESVAWQALFDFTNERDACAMVSWLNGGENPRKPWPSEVL